MNFYVYIIQSEFDKSFYKGFTEHPLKRLTEHNNKDSKYTSTKTPWRLIYVEGFNTKREAIIREKALKKFSIEQIMRLIISPKNVIDKFIVSSVG